MAQEHTHQFHTFDSGLRLVTVPMTGTKTVTVLVLVGTGSKYETKEINGISHFLEHMMFKGTTRRPGYLDISRELDSIGAKYNAFTSKEYTGYYAKASAEKLDTILDVIFDIFLNSRLDEEAIEVEKGVVIEEINRDRDNPESYLGDIFEQLLYGDQPAGWSVLGEKETLMRLTRKDFVRYFETHYVAGNTVVAIAGNIDPEQVKEKVGEHLKHIREGKLVTKLPVVEEQVAPQLKLHYRETDQAHFILGFRAYTMSDRRKYPLALLSVVLGGGMSSRLFDEVREKRGLAYTIGAGRLEYTDSGCFEVAGGVNKDKILEALKVVMYELRRVKHEGITAEELQKAKDQIEGRLALSLEHSDRVAEAYAEPVLFEGMPLTPEEELDKIKEVTLEAVKQVAIDIFDEHKANLAVVGPFKDEEPFRSVLTL